jgi:hypothetical protein
MRTFWRRVLAGGAAAALAVPLTARPAQAVISVPCDPAQLVAAIQTANAAPAGETLVPASNCTYTLTEAFGDTPNGLPRVVKPITIQAVNVTIARAPDAEPFRIFEVGEGGNLTLTGVTVTGGHAAGPEPDGDGGGIYVRGGQARLTGGAVRGNVADRQGGGVWTSGPLTLINTGVAGNAAGSTGGGVLVTGTGTANITGGSFTGNSAIFGGGLANNGTAVVGSATFSGNVVFGPYASGGAIINFRSLQLTGANVISNSALGAGAQGGGLVNSAGTATLTTTTVSGNNATTRPGGIFNNDGTVTLGGGAVAGNQPSNCSPNPIPGCTG